MKLKLLVCCTLLAIIGCDSRSSITSCSPSQGHLIKGVVDGIELGKVVDKTKLVAVAGFEGPFYQTTPKSGLLYAIAYSRRCKDMVEAKEWFDVNKDFYKKLLEQNGKVQLMDKIQQLNDAYGSVRWVCCDPYDNGRQFSVILTQEDGRPCVRLRLYDHATYLRAQSE
jgi:hypothetical protein